MQRSGELPRYPKDLVKPTIVAGINALGRGQDRVVDSIYRLLLRLLDLKA